MIRRYNKRVEIVRVHQHWILDWEDEDAANKEARKHSTSGVWPGGGYVSPTSGTEVYSNKDELIERLRGFL